MSDETFVCAGLASFPDPGAQLCYYGNRSLIKIHNFLQLLTEMVSFMHGCVCVLNRALLHLLTCSVISCFMLLHWINWDGLLEPLF